MSKLEKEIKKIIRNYDQKAGSEISKYISATQEFESMVKSGVACRRGHNVTSVTKVTQNHIKFNI